MSDTAAVVPEIVLEVYLQKISFVLLDPLFSEDFLAILYTLLQKEHWQSSLLPSFRISSCLQVPPKAKVGSVLPNAIKATELAGDINRK